MVLVPPNSVRGGYPLGLTGATAATRYVGATASGAPASGTFAVGDFVIDQSGSAYVCTVAGTPGTWVALGSGGSVWSTYLSFTGANFTDWTNDGASNWSSDGTTFVANPGANVSAIARYTAVYVPGPCVIDFEFRMDSTGTSHTNQSMIVGLGLASSGTKGPAGGLKCNNRDPASTGFAYIENLQTIGYNGDASTWALDTWVSVRSVILGGAGCQVWRDDVLKNQVLYGLGDVGGIYVALKLYSYSMTVKVRNVVVSTLALPA